MGGIGRIKLTVYHQKAPLGLSEFYSTFSKTVNRFLYICQLINESEMKGNLHYIIITLRLIFFENQYFTLLFFNNMGGMLCSK